jgi:hypothetical protein
MVIIEVRFGEKNKKPHVLGKTPTDRRANRFANTLICRFSFFHAALQAFSRDITVESAPAAAAIRPEKFIFDRAGDAPILHSIKGTLFLIWNIKDAMKATGDA